MYINFLTEISFSCCIITTITFEGCFVWLTASLSHSSPAAAAAAASTPVDSLSYPLLVGSLYLMTDIDK